MDENPGRFKDNIVNATGSIGSEFYNFSKFDQVIS